MWLMSQFHVMFLARPITRRWVVCSPRCRHCLERFAHGQTWRRARDRLGFNTSQGADMVSAVTVAALVLRIIGTVVSVAKVGWDVTQFWLQGARAELAPVVGLSLGGRSVDLASVSGMTDNLRKATQELDGLLVVGLQVLNKGRPLSTLGAGASGLKRAITHFCGERALSGSRRGGSAERVIPHPFRCLKAMKCCSPRDGFPVARLVLYEYARCADGAPRV